MRLRVAKQEDFNTISAIYAESWKIAYRGMVSQEYLDGLAVDHWVEKLNSWYEADRYRFLLLCDGESPVGAAAFGASEDERCPAPAWAEIQSLYLRPAYWGQGHGALLFGGVLDALRGEGYQFAYLWALRENLRAKGFYTRQGFADNGDRWEVELAGEMLVDERFTRKL